MLAITEARTRFEKKTMASYGFSGLTSRKLIIIVGENNTSQIRPVINEAHQKTTNFFKIFIVKPPA